MSDIEKLLLGILAVIAWFVYWGICMTLWDTYNINPLYTVFGGFAVIGSIVWIVYKLQKRHKAKVSTRAAIIRKEYPNAYKAYIVDNRIEYKYIDKCVSSIPDGQWAEMEKEASVLNNKCYFIQRRYQKGFEQWAKQNRVNTSYVERLNSKTKKRIIQSEEEIQEYDKRCQSNIASNKTSKTKKNQDVKRDADFDYRKNEDVGNYLDKTVKEKNEKPAETSTHIIPNIEVKSKATDVTTSEITDNENVLRVHYSLSKCRSFKSYCYYTAPIIDTIVFPHRNSKSRLRGYSEEKFEEILKECFSQEKNYLVLGNVSIVPADNVIPYEPDIAIVEKTNKYGIRIDIEIDEPYSGNELTPIHYLGCGDEDRDSNLANLGWIVIRISEKQIVNEPYNCVHYIKKIISQIDNTVAPYTEGKTPNRVQRWTEAEARKLIEQKCREKLLDHQFVKKEKETSLNYEMMKDNERRVAEIINSNVKTEHVALTSKRKQTFLSFKQKDHTRDIPKKELDETVKLEEETGTSTVKKREEIVISPKEELLAASVNNPTQDEVSVQKESVQNQHVGLIENHEYVDLGLSVKWATCNLGASTQESLGEFFNWGKEYSEGGKIDYIHFRKKYYLEKRESFESWGGKIEKIIRQIDKDRDVHSDVNQVDNIENLKAKLRWEGLWRIPSDLEFKELINGCKWEWTIINKNWGYKITSKIIGYTDHFIFLPAAGFLSGDIGGKIMGVDTNGYYWSRSKTEQDDVIYLTFNGREIIADNNTYDFCKWIGYSLRLVHP